jgi:serine/threonine protein phosphatase PrpC
MHPDSASSACNPSSNEGAGRHQPPGRCRDCLLVSSALLLAGVALCRLPGSFPPPSWVQILGWLMRAVPVPLTRLLPTVGQALALLLAWMMFIVVVWRARGWWWPQPGAGVPSPASSLTSQEEQQACVFPSADPVLAPRLLAHTAEQGVYQEEALHPASAGQTIPLLAQRRMPSAEVAPVCLLTLHTARSAPAQHRGIPLPLYEAGQVEVPVGWAAPWQEGMGWLVAACCRPSSRRSLIEQEDGLLVAAGLRLWPDQPLSLGPVGLCAVADGRIVQSDQEPLSTSHLVVEELGRHLVPTLFARDPLSAQAALKLLLAELSALNASLYQRLCSAQQAQAETALCVLLLLGTTAYVASVGDCRAYLYRQSEGLLQVTYDHRTVGAESASEDQARDAEEARQTGRALYRSLGSQEHVEADVFSVQVQRGDVLLLCSDGFWRGIDQEQVLSVLEEQSQADERSASMLCARLSQQVQVSGPLSLILLHLLPLKKLAAEEHAPAQTVRGKDRRERRRRGRKEPAPTRPPHRTSALERSEP